MIHAGASDGTDQGQGRPSPARMAAAGRGRALPHRHHVAGGGAAILASDASGTLKAAAGLLFFPIPEIFDVSAIAVLGKPGREWLKAKLFGALRRAAHPDRVGPTRHRIGLVMFVLPLLMGSLGPYMVGRVPLLASSPRLLHAGGDLMFLPSFFILGGDFWDRVRALFVHRARAVSRRGRPMPTPVTSLTRAFAAVLVLLGSAPSTWQTGGAQPGSLPTSPCCGGAWVTARGQTTAGKAAATRGSDLPGRTSPQRTERSWVYWDLGREEKPRKRR